MKKLIKPLISVECYTDEIVKAFCEHEFCSGNCKIDCTSYYGCMPVCNSINQVEIDDDILF